jgi:hypothetical protein
MYHVLRRHLFRGMSRCAQLSRYASGSLAAAISSLVALAGAVLMLGVVKIALGEVQTPTIKPNSLLDALCDRHVGGPGD